MGQFAVEPSCFVGVEVVADYPFWLPAQQLEVACAVDSQSLSLVHHCVAEVAVFGGFAQISAETGDQTRQHDFSKGCALFGLSHDTVHLIAVLSRVELEISSNEGNFIDEIFSLVEGFEVEIVAAYPGGKLLIFVSFVFLQMLTALAFEFQVLFVDVPNKEKVALFVAELIKFVLFVFVPLLLTHEEQVGKVYGESQYRYYGLSQAVLIKLLLFDLRHFFERLVQLAFDEGFEHQTLNDCS